ncbi:MAG: phage holin family protein [Polyangiaceae bacterium]|nr:phage holin family protein [Polyangiaceae bacterium]
MLEGILVSWAVITLGVWVASLLLSGFRVRGGAGSFFVVAALIGVLDVLLGWLIFVVLGVATLGIGFLLAFITRWIVNAIVLKIADALSSRFQVKSFGTAMLAALVISAVGIGADSLTHFVLR